MRVLFVNALYPTRGDRRATGGAETFSVRLVEGLVARGHHVTVVRSGTSRSSQVEYTADGVPVHSMPCFNIYPVSDGLRHGTASRMAWHLLEDRGRVAPAFARTIEQARPDFMHSNNVVGLTTDIWRVAKAAGLPVIHTLHDYYLTCPKVLRFVDGERCVDTCRSCAILSQARRRATRHVDHVVGVSQRMLDIHRGEGLFLDTPSEVILNAPPPRPDPVAPLPRPLGARPVFGFIGRQSPEKGIFDLLTAFAALGPGAAKLLIAGAIDPAVETWVKQNAPCPDDIALTGYVAPEAFFPAIDVAVFPSIWEEPCSMGVGEAFAFGVPVLGSNRGGTPELLEGGRLGWSFQPGTDELRLRLAELAAGPDEIAAKADAVRRLPHRTADRLVDAYLAAYGRIGVDARQGAVPA